MSLRLRVVPLDAAAPAVPRLRELARLAEKVLRGEGLQGRVNLVFCENAHIRDLNARFRNLPRVTDVLSFHYGETDILGEVYIASQQARDQAPRWKNSFYRELQRLVVHGSLHLAGYDHMRAKDRKIMRDREEFYLEQGK